MDIFFTTSASHLGTKMYVVCWLIECGSMPTTTSPLPMLTSYNTSEIYQLFFSISNSKTRIIQCGLRFCVHMFGIITDQYRALCTYNYISKTYDVCVTHQKYHMHMPTSTKYTTLDTRLTFFCAPLILSN